MPRWRIGIDSGGTFCDVALFEEETGRVAVWKVSSTPDDPSRGIAGGLSQGLAEVGAEAGEVGYFGHGTTVATNALIQGRTARTGLITTEGFRDLLEIGRQKRPHLYDLQIDKPPPLVPRDLRLEVAERLRHDGRVERAASTEELARAAAALAAEGVEAAAVCFLYGYLDPAHEKLALRALAEALPGKFICASHEVAPEFREFERLSTTCINAGLGPVVREYLARLRARLAEAGIGPAPKITQSNGGTIGFETAEAQPVRTVLSGPATGVVGAAEVGAAAGFANLITFDMGGTSCDVALLQGANAALSGDQVVHGWPLKVPMLDINTVGAGGGSIAWIDSGGLMKVGPQSAGANPGPACYGLGNPEPTVTDANVVLGTLHPTHLLGGRMAIDRARSIAAIDAIAAPLGLSRMEAAQGVIRVVTANMAKAIRVISVQRGHDPRDYALCAFGGAGPLHAARLAAELDMRRILVPRNPGILCAMGLLLSDLRRDFAATHLMALDGAAEPRIAEIFARLAGQAAAWFDAEQIAAGARLCRRSIDMRYAGQNFELAVDADDPALLAERFAAAHTRAYGYALPGEAMQCVTFRLQAIACVPKARLLRHPEAGEDAAAAVAGERRTWLPELGGEAAVPVYDRDRLLAGNRFTGPAIIEQMDATTLVLPGMTARIDQLHNLILEWAP
ncbi:MAG: hydantoinase/oxoprolinase family protein [Acetobacteraceae bacterium]|nr:hydantoinase/oxoprolinase family protein [Acetobacteraceae bacterium]